MKDHINHKFNISFRHIFILFRFNRKKALRKKNNLALMKNVNPIELLVTQKQSINSFY